MNRLILSNAVKYIDPEGILSKAYNTHRKHEIVSLQSELKDYYGQFGQHLNELNLLATKSYSFLEVPVDMRIKVSYR